MIYSDLQANLIPSASYAQFQQSWTQALKPMVSFQKNFQVLLEKCRDLPIIT